MVYNEKSEKAFKNQFRPKIENVNGKTSITFDPESRREYITGFRKRRKQRQEIAKKEEERQLHILKKKALKVRKVKEEERLRSLEEMTRLPGYLNDQNSVSEEEAQGGESDSGEYVNDNYRVTTSIIPLDLSTSSLTAQDLLKETRASMESSSEIVQSKLPYKNSSSVKSKDRKIRNIDNSIKKNKKSMTKKKIIAKKR